MALRAKKPEAAAKRMKALFYGAAGAGKTTAAIQFPKPYLIDTERGAENEQYARRLNERGGVILQTNVFAEIVSEVKALLSEEHDYQTLIIDPITTIYDDLIEAAEKEVGSDFGRHYGHAKKEWKRLGNLLMRLDMNVIVTSHQKNLYGDAMKVLGQTFDGPKGLDYLFDLVFEVQTRGNERVGVVRKTRCEGFPEGEVFPFAYDQIADRYGRTILERKAEPVALASPEQVKVLLGLLEVRKDGEELLEKMLKKTNADAIEDMPADVVEKAIAYYTPKTEVAA